jgi:kynurenine formamidase
MSDSAALLRQLVEALQGGAIRVVDLTAPLDERSPIIQLPEPFGNAWPFQREPISHYDERGPAWYWSNFRTSEHTGTHFDAPIHWLTGRDLPDNATDTILPARFIGPACVIDVESAVAQDADFLMTPRHIEDWEAQYGRIPAGAWVLARTGWSRYLGDATRYLNVGPDGSAHSPGWTVACARLLAAERDVLGVGVETVGTDAGIAATFDPPFGNHNVMHGHGKFGLTSLINLDQLPPVGAVLIAAPLKITHGSGSPVRAIALVP